MLNNIDFDILLEYLSYIKTGTLQQFNNYINNLDYYDELETYEYSNIRRMFSRLSHIEFDYTTRKFSVCPPTILISNNIGILSGYRTQDFVAKISKKYNIKIIDNNQAPKLITININNTDQFIVDFPNVRISRNFSSKFINIIPEISQVEKALLALEQPLPFTQPNINFYNIKNYKFEKIEFLKPSEGLYCELFPGNNQYFFYKNENWFNINKEYGIFMAHKLANNQNLFKYSINRLGVIKYIQPPELIDRALTMLSGQNPYTKNNYIIYENVSYAIAKKIATILGQKLEVNND